MIRNSVAARHTLLWGAVLKYNFIRINHNLHDFSVIHSHLKLNFIDAWREPSLWVVHCQWTSWAEGVGQRGGKEGREWRGGGGWWLFLFKDGGINDRKTRLGLWHSASCVCVCVKRTTWKDIRNIHHQVLTTQNLHSMGMRSDQFKEKKQNKKMQHPYQHWIEETHYVYIL